MQPRISRKGLFLFFIPFFHNFLFLHPAYLCDGISERNPYWKFEFENFSHSIAFPFLDNNNYYLIRYMYYILNYRYLCAIHKAIHAKKKVNDETCNVCRIYKNMRWLNVLHSSSLNSSSCTLIFLFLFLLWNQMLLANW